MSLRHDTKEGNPQIPILSRPSPPNTFDVVDLKADFKGRAVRGAAVTFCGQSLKVLLQLISTVVLARLLTPQDFGLIAMVTALTGFILIFRELGLSAATVQRPEINHDQISTLFWINAAFGFALALLTIALAPVVVRFYKEPRLYWITIAMAGSFIFGGLTVQHQALLNRQMRFLALVVVDLIALTISVITGIICACLGLGYWSLVFMQLATPLATVIGVWTIGSWRPRLPVRNSGVRSMLAFGGNLTAYNIINYFSRNLDNILIGRYWGAIPLGYYAKAYSLLIFPMGQITGPITAVAVPALSRLQTEPERYRNWYLRAILLIAYISMPLVVVMGVLSNEIVSIVLGRQWAQAGPVFRILAIPALSQPVACTVGWIYISLGQARRMLIWSCLAIPITILSFLIGLPWGASGIAMGYAVSNYILIYPLFAFALKKSPIKPLDVFEVCARPFGLSVILGLAMAFSRIYMHGLEPPLIIVLSIGSGAITFIFLAFGVKPMRNDLNIIIESIRSLN